MSQELNDLPFNLELDFGNPVTSEDVASQLGDWMIEEFWPLDLEDSEFDLGAEFKEKEDEEDREDHEHFVKVIKWLIEYSFVQGERSYINEKINKLEDLREAARELMALDIKTPEQLEEI